MVGCPGPADATSLYRAHGPLNWLEKDREDIELLLGSQNAQDYEWCYTERADILFFQRPSTPTHYKILEAAKSHNIPVWIDYDDDLTCVPQDNPASVVYNTPDAQKAMRLCLEIADHVTVSTEELKTRYSQYRNGKPITVIRNSINLKKYPFPEIRKERQKVILWRGSNTHTGDLMEYADSILEIAKDYPDWKWYFIGYNPWFITDKMKPGAWATGRWTGHQDYFGLIASHQAPILMVPLKDNAFNQAKSHIAWIEGIWSGASVIAPGWGEWDHYNTKRYVGQKSFKGALKQAMHETTTNIDLARAEIRNFYSLEVANDQRMEVIYNLLGRTKPPESVL